MRIHRLWGFMLQILPHMSVYSITSGNLHQIYKTALHIVHRNCVHYKCNIMSRAFKMNMFCFMNELLVNAWRRFFTSLPDTLLTLSGKQYIIDNSCTLKCFCLYQGPVCICYTLPAMWNYSISVFTQGSNTHSFIPGSEKRKWQTLAWWFVYHRIYCLKSI